MSYRENKTHPHAEHKNDLYEMPGVAVHALLATEWLLPRSGNRPADPAPSFAT